MLKSSQITIENNNEDLQKELTKVKSEKDNMIKEWEKQVIELTYSIDSLKKRVYGDKMLTERSRKSNKESGNLNRSGNKESGKMYIENYLE